MHGQLALLPWDPGPNENMDPSLQTVHGPAIVVSDCFLSGQRFTKMLSPGNSSMEVNFDPVRLRKITDEMVEALTSQPFVEAMRAVRSAPPDQRLVEASRRLTPAALRAQGVKLPTDMRISSRYFEAGLPAGIDVGDYPGGRMNLVNALNEAQPGLLDRLKTTNPDLFTELVTVGRGPGPIENTCGCACGGGASFCGGAGGGTGLVYRYTEPPPPDAPTGL